jgi:hypothetical protein
MSPSVNLIATGRWFKGMKGAANAASPQIKINTRGDVMGGTGGIWYSTDVEWDFEEKFLSMAPVVSLLCAQGFGETWEFIQRFHDNPKDRFG